MRRNAPRSWILATAAIIGCALLASGPAAASPPPQLVGLPTDRERLGDAFVEAWLSLRRDLDASAQAGVHPALFEAWFAAMPRPVLRDAARISTNQQVVLAAAARLADGARDEDRRLLADLERRYADTANSAAIRALRIAAGDRAARRAAEELLLSPEPLVALDGAVVLAAAGDSRGLVHLRRAVERGEAISPWAARALGLYGSDSDAAILAAARARGVDANAIGVGLGGIAIRRTYPLHAAMLARRDPSFRRFEAVGGLYDTWLEVIGQAVAEGARDLSGLLAHVDRERAKAVGEDDEVIQRELQALVDFWSEVEACVRATAPTISWPTRFEEAQAWLSARGVKEATPLQFARRLAAAIAILANACGRLGYESLAAPTPALVLLTAGSGRAADGSFATSWRGAPGAAIEIDVGAGKGVEKLWIASGCPDAPAASIREIRVGGRGAGGTWSISHRFERATRYFAEVPLGARRTGRITLEIVEPIGKVACVSELRAE